MRHHLHVAGAADIAQDNPVLVVQRHRAVDDGPAGCRRRGRGHRAGEVVGRVRRRNVAGPRRKRGVLGLQRALGENRALGVYRQRFLRRDGAAAQHQRARRIAFLHPEFGMVFAESRANGRLKRHVLAGHRSVHGDILAARHRDRLSRRHGASEHLRRHLAFHRHVLAGHRCIGIVGAAVETHFHALGRRISAAGRLKDDVSCGSHRAAHVDVADRVDRHIAGLGLDLRDLTYGDILASLQLDIRINRLDFTVDLHAASGRGAHRLALEKLAGGDGHLLVAYDGGRCAFACERLEHYVAVGLDRALDSQASLCNGSQVAGLLVCGITEINISQLDADAIEIGVIEKIPKVDRDFASCDLIDDGLSARTYDKRTNLRELA